jgi:AraC-like DNA-binding protein
MIRGVIAYREVAPPTPLAGCVKALWELNGDGVTAPQRVLPDGCIDLVIHVGRSGHVVGSLLHGLDVPLVGPTHVVGACLRPGAAARFLGVSADALTDSVATLADLLGDGAARVEDAVGRAEPGGALAALSRSLVERGRDLLADPVCAAAAHRFRETPGLSVAVLADDMGLSTRQLERRFRAHVGLSPKAYGRVVRFDRAVRRLGDGTPLALLALECGYADQAHLCHEFRALAGRSVREHVAIRQDAPVARP